MSERPGLEIIDLWRGRDLFMFSFNRELNTIKKKKMDLIIRNLVDAGYLRARISSLSDFDKVIGGMAWAMQVFSREIDINIFYRDSLDLGQKIALTERLVMVLLVMNCPHKIEPHQIVGLDHANLLPVIKWLIKRSAEIRRDHEAFNRLLALRHYHRVTNTLPGRQEWCHVLRLDQLRHLTGGFGQQDSAERIGSTSGQTGEMADSIEAALIRRLREDFKDNQLISLVDSQPAFISSAAGQHSVGGSAPEEDGHSESELSSSSSSSSSLDELEPSEQRGEKTGLDVAQHEYAQLKPEPEAATAAAAAESVAVRKEPAEDSAELVALHKELDLELLATNQKILNQLRKLDSMPTELEISQYQRRYIELHQQLISKNKDLKKVYALYNSLDSEKHYLTKEINLLDSIMSNLDLTNNSAANRFEFLKQLQEIIGKIKAVRDEVSGRLEVMRIKCNSLNEEYTKLRNSCAD